MRQLLLFIVLNVVVVVICVAEIPVVLGAQSLLVGPHQPIVALVGEDVLLPCYLKPAVSADDETVEWTRSGLEPKYVHFHKDGQLGFEKQDESYFLRTRLFMDELPRGNVSMQIFKVKESDAGTYKCSLPSMKTEAHIQLIVGFIVHCPDKAMKAVAGQNVTLRCSTDPPVKPDTVDWTVNGTDCDVYLLLKSKVDLTDQCEDYKGKTSLFPDELSSGNSSLRLMTQLSHSGTYQCLVRVRHSNDSCSINLTVSLPRDPHPDPNKIGNQTAVDPPGNSNNSAAISVGSIVGISVSVIVGVIAMIVLIFVVVYCLPSKKCNHQQGRQNPARNNETVGVQHQDRDPAREPMNPSGNRDEIEMRIMGTPADDNV